MIAKNSSLITPWRALYKPDKRKTSESKRWPIWVRNLRGEAKGVYAIRCVNCKRVLYIGRSTAKEGVGRRLQRHFWQMNHRYWIHRHVMYEREKVEAKVWVMEEASVAEAEARLIKIHKPKDNQRLEKSVLERPEEIEYLDDNEVYDEALKRWTEDIPF